MELRRANNDIKSIQTKYSIIIVMLMVIVALMTAMLLGKKAETYTYPLNCVLTEHEHSEECYDEAQQLSCEQFCHQHIAGCFQKDVPEGIVQTMGYVIPYKMVNETEENHNSVINQDPEVLNEPIFVEDVPFTKEGEVAPLNIAPYEYLVELEYYDEDSKSWIKIVNDIIVPIDAKIRLTYNFTKLDIVALQNADGKAYYRVPDPLRNNIAESGLEDNEGNKIGVATRGEDNRVDFTFDQNWIDEMITQGTKTLDGSFMLSIGIDPKVVGGNSKYEIEFEKSKVNVNFDEDWQSKRAMLDVEKTTPTVIETEDGAYFEYTISVTASIDGVDVSNVKVTDFFTSARQHIESYVGVGATSSVVNASNPAIAPVETKPNDAQSSKVYLGKLTEADVIPAEGSYNANQAPGTLVWDIGNMKAGETRTLTYRTKIKESLTHTNAIKENNTTVKNKAKAYSKEYLRDDAEAIYTTNNQFTSGCHQKNNNGAFTDENGDIIVRFRILVEPRPSNDFSFQDLTIRDELFPTHASWVTPEELRPYISFVKDSFRLYEGNVDIPAYDTGTQIPIEDGALTFFDSQGYFELNLGTMSPGECISLIYDVKLDKAAYTVFSSDFQIANTFITLNGTDTHVDQRIDRFSNEAYIDGKIWSRKMADDATTEVTSVPIPSTDEVYDAEGQLTTEVIEGFNVPVGAYRYFIIVNEDGKWDLSNATLTDELGEYLRYSGYVKINAYDITNTSFDAEANTNPNVVEDFLKTQPLIKTTWLDIDGLQSFSFHPNQVGHSGRTAYTLEYYAIPHNVEDVSSVSVKNTFILSGDVGDGIGIGGSGSIIVDKYVTVTGGESFGVKKQGWMFEKDVPNDPQGLWLNGRMTWVVEVDANLKENLEFRDVIPGDQQWYYYESMVGVYVGNLGFGKTWNDFESLEDFEANANVRKLNGVRSGSAITDEVDYSASFHNNREIWVKLEKDIEKASGDFLYLIFSSTVKDNAKPDYSTLDVKTYNNSVYMRQNQDEGWVHMTDAVYNVSSKGPVYKEFDGMSMTNKDGYIPLGDVGQYGFDKVLWDYVAESGFYSEWYANLNWNGEVAGLVEMSDILPKGLEPVYVRMFEIGPDYDSAGLALEKPITPDIPELENEGWVKHTTTAVENNGSNELSCTYYYNPTTNEIRWNVDNLYYGGTTNSRNVKFQVIAKVVAPELILPSNEVTFNNTIKVKDQDGKVTTDTASGSMTRENLTKDVSEEYKDDDANFGNKIPFVVDVNTYGIDMNASGDTLTMLDEPGRYLTFDTESIKVYELTTPGVFTNIANQATVTATGNNIHGSEGPRNLVDGDKTSLFKFYNGAMSSEQTIFVAFDETQLMNQFTIAYEHAGSYDEHNYHFTYSIYAQNSTIDNTAWDLIADHVVANRTDNYQQIHTFDAKTYDNVKIVMHSCKTGADLTGTGWPAVAEFEVYAATSNAGQNVQNNYLNPIKTELDISKWNAALEVKEDGSEVLKLTLPDNKWLRIEYMMEYTGPKGTTVSISNNVRWDGMPKESGSDYEDESFQYDVIGTFIPNQFSNIEVIKVDENNLRKYLEGAEFEVIKCQVEADGSITELTNQSKKIVTDKNGYATTSGFNEGLEFNTVYCIKETKAPLGYILKSEPMYFVVAKQINIDGTMAYPEFPEDVYVYTQSATYTYTCLNGKGRINLEKKFFANENNETQMQDGTYHFGLFDEKDPKKSPLQVLTLEITDGNAIFKRDGVETSVLQFNNIDVDKNKAYYIYELDLQNRPIKEGSFVQIDGASYLVRYPDDSAIIVDGSGIPTKEVHNYLTYKLPESGGIGTSWYKLFGFTIILLSIFVFSKKKERRILTLKK